MIRYIKSFNYEKQKLETMDGCLEDFLQAEKITNATMNDEMCRAMN